MSRQHVVFLSCPYIRRSYLLAIPCICICDCGCGCGYVNMNIWFVLAIYESRIEWTSFSWRRKKNTFNSIKTKERNEWILFFRLPVLCICILYKCSLTNIRFKCFFHFHIFEKKKKAIEIISYKQPCLYYLHGVHTARTLRAYKPKWKKK